ncbi:hypothetical protein [Streptomyces solicathayae]|uniref:Uncharacterized protein n=1 Tax=Streptomyces solicathayae TaxID=3081768 RepID=A0ABZ0LKN1_9ACTN|nr:hypothetical protein [Streptomyces sp. HUAS YS2]WOX19972.1 hypothetical protein R2D22_00580 [Streptomyces sp. HUAS YS2]
METPEPSWRRRLLMEALTVVAAPVSAQEAWLKKHGVETDEIALDFDHAFRMVEGLMEEGLVSRDVLPDLRMIDSIFDEMSRDESPNRWAATALSSDAEWIRARGLAQRVLTREGVDASVLPDICVVR